MKEKLEVQQCNRCLMDTSDPDIWFNNDGVCKHCLRYDKDLEIRTFSGELGENELKKIISKIKSSNRRYNCLIGVSGGVDSTYVAYLVKKIYQLKPLAVHIDNGWNSNIANNNIEKTLGALDIPLETYVLNWREFKNLQVAFLKSSTPDGEIPTDHAINAKLFEIAARENIKFIINGMNFRTESMHIDKWAYGHGDWKYIKSVNRLFNKKPLKHYPHFSMFALFKYIVLRRIKVISILNYFEYKKDDAIKILKNELEWEEYGGKHYESVYTKFFQGYWLVEKFNIDKRKAHLSDLIRSKQITKEKAMDLITIPPLNKDQIDEDILYVRKKLDLTEEEFCEILSEPNKTFLDYPNNFKIINALKKTYNKLRFRGIVSK